MPRSRNIKPAFFKDDQLHQHGPMAALLFAGLWTIADKAGRLKDRPQRIKAECLPYYYCDVEQLLEKLSEGPESFIHRYVVDDVAYIQIRSWEKHQSPHHKEDDSQIPSMEHASESGISNQASGINNQESPIRNQASGRSVPCQNGASTGLGCPTTDQASSKQESSMAQAWTKNGPSKFDPSSVQLPFDSADFHKAWSDWIQHRKEIKKPLTPTSTKQQLAKFRDLGEARSIAAIHHTIVNGWVGLREPDSKGAANPIADRNGRLQRSLTAAQRFVSGGGNDDRR